MSKPLRTMALKTPARIFRLVETETTAFGITRSLEADGTIWGDFRPADPRRQMTGEGEAYVVQAASFTCRALQGLSHGAVLRINERDWTITAVSVDGDGYVTLSLEQVPS
jgi:hypothetical protein